MPSRRKQARVRQKQTKPFQIKKSWIVLFIVVLITFLIGNFLLSSGIKVDSFSVVYSQDNGDAVVAVYDFENNYITQVSVPGDAGVTTGFGLGEWRVKSLTKLGEQEKLGGELLRMSMVKAFHFPVDAWSYGKIPSTNPVNLSSFITSNSSLSMKEKLQLALFSIKTSGLNSMKINLTTTSYLREAKLSDGEMGYEITRTLPPQIATIFTDMSDDVMSKVGVYDKTGGAPRTLGDATAVIHVLGGDWAVIEQPSVKGDCFVRGETDMAIRINRIFLCERVNENVEGNFDVEIILGEDFSKRF